MTKSKRRECPECGLKHIRKYATPLGNRMIWNCNLYFPGRSVEQENKVFNDYLLYCNFQNELAHEK